MILVSFSIICWMVIIFFAVNEEINNESCFSLVGDAVGNVLPHMRLHTQQNNEDNEMNF